MNSATTNRLRLCAMTHIVSAPVIRTPTVGMRLRNPFYAVPHPGSRSFKNTISLDQFVARRLGGSTRYFAYR